MPKVTIVTRTKNRNLLLRRAIESVSRQTVADWTQIIVNDGGDPTELDQLLASQPDVDQARRKVIHNATSLGMEAASNLGLRASESEYVVVHDDDDSWHPEFLERTIGFLEGPAGHRFAGVVTHSVKVTEVIEGANVTITGRELFNGYLEKIDLHELAAGNLYPPISFLYKREVFAALGYYREDLPPLADWEFNLRFLSRFHIGLLAEPLANYHHRVTDRGSAYANTVVGGIRQHILLDAVVLNEITGRDIVSGAASLGAIIQSARGFGGVYGEFKRLDQRFDRLERLLLSGVRDDLKTLLAKPGLTGEDSAKIVQALSHLNTAGADTGPNPAETDPTFLGYLAELRRMLSDGSVPGSGPAIVFGASPFGEKIVELLQPRGIEVVCIFDNSLNKIGSKVQGVPVVKPRMIATAHLVINASINHNVAIHQQIQILAAGARSTIISFNHPVETTA